MQTRADEQELRRIIRANDWLTATLDAGRDCAPPDWAIGAGAIRGAVWDWLHGYSLRTPSRDVDVAFFDPENLRPEREHEIEAQLTVRLPGVPWDAKNQAAVHLWYESKFGLPAEPLTSVEDAVGTWPETATCVAVRLLPDGELRVLAPLGLADLFEMILRRNPRRCTPELFQRRLHEKGFQEKWPRVRVIDG